VEWASIGLGLREKWGEAFRFAGDADREMLLSRNTAYIFAGSASEKLLDP